MKNTLISILILLMVHLAYSQTPAVNWEDVNVFQFEAEWNYPDSLEICGGEWFIKTKANSLAELTPKELKTIKQQVAQYGCNVVFVDGKRLDTWRPGQMYYLGLKRKED